MLVVGGLTRLSAQDHTADVINMTITKMNAIKRDYRVIEKTVGDVLFPSDTAGDNRFFTYGFSSSKRYHLNAFAPNADISAISILVYAYDANNKIQLITRKDIQGSDVVLNFDPNESKTYYLFVSGTLRQNVQSSFFNLIIDRD